MPVREIFKHPAFSNLATNVLNNYGTPSIYSELAWALDPDHPFVTDENIVEVQIGRFVDLHLPSTIRPETREVVVGGAKLLPA